MMVVGLLLAQLVQSWPGLDSPLVQPPGMICLGECAGPVVWGPAERGRLVVACDMRSDTCSDGRQITTTRSTPVPCEVSPGVWEMVGVDEGCYGVRGLEAWAATTSYLAYGAELDRSPWGVTAQATLAKQDGFYRISGVNNNSRVYQILASPEAGDWTLSCIMRTAASQNARLRIYQEGGSGGDFCNLDSSDTFSTYSCTQTITGTPTHLAVHVYTGIGHIDVQGCWLTKSDTPGRACWGGEAPVTCGRELTTIPTTGFPTTRGVMRIHVTLLGDATDHRAILDGGSGTTLRLAIQTNNAIRLSWDGANPTTNVLEWVYGRTYVIELRFNGSTISMFRDGVFLRDFTYSRPVEWAATASIGANLSGGWLLNGAIRALTVRSYEEVSP